jgi:hypothetical protein
LINEKNQLTGKHVIEMCNGIVCHVLSRSLRKYKIIKKKKIEENKDFNIWQNIHEANERIPIEALTFGADAIFKVLRRFGK